MKTRIMIILLILSLGLNLGVFATFGRHWLLKKEFGRGHREDRWLRDRMQKELKLTDKQMEFIERNRGEIHKETKLIREGLQKKREELFDLVAADTVDEVKINTLINDLALLQTKMEKTIIGHLLNMKKNLTPEQQKKLKAVMQKGFARRPPDRWEGK